MIIILLSTSRAIFHFPFDKIHTGVYTASYNQHHHLKFRVTMSERAITTIDIRRLAVSGLLLFVLAVVFWVTSRYPALDEKAMMGGGIKLEDPLSFEAYMPVLESYPVWKKIYVTTINWIMTNRQGMTFGIMFGAAFLTFLKYLPRRSFQNGFGNSLLGFFIGAPLGVCVNCSAPIARGMYVAGARLETTLSAMIASPTYNVVVISLMLGLLPFYLVAAKLVLSLVVILAAVPLVCRMLPSGQLQLGLGEQAGGNCELESGRGVSGETMVQSVVQTGREFLKNLWFIVRTTVPLMLLAGVLGAALATIVPLETLRSYEAGLVSLTMAALIGLILPAPIAFDVVLAAALLGAGVPVEFVMVLLFTLGIFSIYSFFIIARTVSLRVAVLLSAVILVLGVLSGYGVAAYNKWSTKRALDVLTSGLLPGFVSPALADEAGFGGLQDSAGHRLVISRHANRARSPAGDRPFSRIEARHIGIDRPIEFTFRDYWAPFWSNSGSVSLADIDNDGDLDAVLANTRTSGGVRIYINDGTGRFRQRDRAVPQMAGIPVFHAVPVDLNNDGWLDLFIATYNQGNHFLLSKQGRFDEAKVLPAANHADAIVSYALSFADVDLDGDVDGVAGNWSAGWYRRVPGEESRNAVFLNNGRNLPQFAARDLSGLAGETLSILLSDFNHDGKPDLIVGNDFLPPDIFYFGNGDGTFTRIRPADGIIPVSTTTTMAVKTADFNNDLKLDLYMAQITGRASGQAKRLIMQDRKPYCDTIERAGDRKRCLVNNDIRGWYRPGNNLDPALAVNCLKLAGENVELCKAMMIKDLAIQNKNYSLCNYIKPRFKLARTFCDIHFKPVNFYTNQDYADNIPSILHENVLLMDNGKGGFENRAEDAGLEVSGWSWDVKVVDFDLDGWQDVFIVNGWWARRDQSPSNLFFLNRGEGRFSNMTVKFGMVDFLDTPGAAAGDIDNDGDIDLITSPINGPVIAYINNSQAGHSIRFRFRDHVGNFYGIGNKVIITHGKNGAKRQLREIKLGGGFTSFDPAVVHFGLGKDDTASMLEIFWSTGEKSVLKGPFKADGVYIIERFKK